MIPFKINKEVFEYGQWIFLIFNGNIRKDRIVKIFVKVERFNNEVQSIIQYEIARTDGKFESEELFETKEECALDWMKKQGLATGVVNDETTIS